MSATNAATQDKMKEVVQRYKTLREQAGALKEKHAALRAEKAASDERITSLETELEESQFME